MVWNVFVSSTSMTEPEAAADVKWGLSFCCAKRETPSGVVSHSLALFCACEVCPAMRTAIARRLILRRIIPRFLGLGELQGPQVVKMHDSFDVTRWRKDDERGDLSLFHQSEGRRGEGVGVDGEGLRVHDLAGCVFEGVGAVAFEQAAKVPVGDHAHEFAVCGQDGCHAEFLA